MRLSQQQLWQRSHVQCWGLRWPVHVLEWDLRCAEPYDLSINRLQCVGDCLQRRVWRRDYDMRDGVLSGRAGVLRWYVYSFEYGFQLWRMWNRV